MALQKKDGLLVRQESWRCPAGEIERGVFQNDLPDFLLCDYKVTSCAGLTRASIFRRAMECRVKPGNDDYRLSFRDGPKDQTRNLEIPGSMLRIAPE